MCVGIKGVRDQQEGEIDTGIAISTEWWNGRMENSSYGKRGVVVDRELGTSKTDTKFDT